MLAVNADEEGGADEGDGGVDEEFGEDFGDCLAGSNSNMMRGRLGVLYDGARFACALALGHLVWVILYLLVS